MGKGKGGKKGKNKPILGVLTLAALLSGIFGNKCGFPHSAGEYLLSYGDAASAVNVLQKSIMSVDSYTPAIVPGLGWIVLHTTKVGKKKILGNWSIA